MHNTSKLSNNPSLGLMIITSSGINVCLIGGILVKNWVGALHGLITQKVPPEDRPPFLKRNYHSRSYPIRQLPSLVIPSSVIPFLGLDFLFQPGHGAPGSSRTVDPRSEIEAIILKKRGCHRSDTEGDQIECVVCRSIKSGGAQTFRNP